MNKPVLMCDVDETVAPSVKKWVNWYHDLTGHVLTHEMHVDGVSQDLLDLMHRHDEPMKFWRDPQLYHGMRPRKGCVEVLEKLSEKYDIVFVSNSFSEHSDSKKLFLTKWFPFHKGYIATSEKKFVKAAVFLDDYKNYLRRVQEYQPDCLCIQIKTHLSNKGEFPLLEWDEVIQYIEENT